MTVLLSGCGALAHNADEGARAGQIGRNASKNGGIGGGLGTGTGGGLIIGNETKDRTFGGG